MKKKVKTIALQQPGYPYQPAVSVPQPYNPYIFEEFYKKEPVQNAAPETTNSIDYQSEIDKLWGEINALKNRQKPQNNKRREDGDTGNVR